MKLGFISSKIPSWCLPALGYAISIASLIWVMWGVDTAAIWQDLKRIEWWWIWLAAAGDIITYVIGAWRWNLLLAPVVRVPLRRSVQSIYVGLFANEILPLRPGELIRAFLLARWVHTPFPVILSSAVVERILDGIWLCIAFFVTAAFVTLPGWMVEFSRVTAFFVVLLAGALGVVMFRKHHARAACPKTKWGAQLQLLIEDLHLMGNSRTFYWSLLASVPYLLLQVVPVYALIQAYGLDLSLGPAMVVLLVLRVGTLIPQAPGNVGTAQAMIVLALGLFGVDKTTATGLAFMIWGAITLPLLLAGFIALAATGMRLQDLTAHASAESEQGKAQAAPVPESPASRTV